jgi:hypothetical protein
VHSFEQAGDERFGEAPAEAETATERLAQAIEWCLPLPGSQERDWVLWVELWLRAVRDPELRPVAARLYRRDRAWIADVIRSGVDRASSGAMSMWRRRRISRRRCSTGRACGC